MAVAERPTGTPTTPPILQPPPDFPQRAELERISDDFGRTYFESLIQASDDDTRDRLGIFLSGYGGVSLGDGPSGTVIVLATMLNHLSETETQRLAMELSELFGRYS